MDKNPLEMAIETVLDYEKKIGNPNYWLKEKDYTALTGAIKTISDQYATNTPKDEWDKHPLYRHILVIRDIMFKDCERIRQNMLEMHKGYMRKAEKRERLTEAEEEQKDISAWFR